MKGEYEEEKICTDCIEKGYNATYSEYNYCPICGNKLKKEGD